MRIAPLPAFALASLLIACIAEQPASQRFADLMRDDAGVPAELWLSRTGLYSDTARKRVAPELRAYEPAFALWSDGADKRRWLYLPSGALIDSSDMDHWQFPIGTVAYKEFSRAGRRIETRVIARIGVSEYWMGAFLWKDDESDARYVPDGQRNARGTDHDVPSSTQCGTCHNGEPGKLLGFSAVQQPRVARELLSHPPRIPFAPPGDPTTARALGYLHANCSHCHNPNGSARPDTDMNLRLSVGDRNVASTHAYLGTVGRPLQSFAGSELSARVLAGDPSGSAVLQRMLTRESALRMPPLGTERVDPSGVAAVRAWITSLP
jgi:mono/diheme cytochrome c family protein